MVKEVKLYRKNQLGVGTWRIWHEVHDSSHATLHYAHATTMGGAEVHHQDTVTLNQSGRNIEEQVRLEMRSRISRQLDKGYKPSHEEAVDSGSTNQMGLINPMLAQPLDKVKITDADLKNAYMQRKYDGHRTLITNYCGDIIAYTRRGKPITTISHILNHIKLWLPEGVTLDGELYIHGVELQGISSIIKRVQPANAKLRFHWYDLVDESLPSLTYHPRYLRMQRLLGEYRHESYEIVPTYPVSTMEQARAMFHRFRAEKYEGGILRLDNSPYRDAVRSSSLIKLKAWQDEEVTVIGCRPSKEGWAVLTVQRDSGQVFETSAPGSVPQKTFVLKNFEQYRGKRLTIEYASLTNDGIPFHASALRWREDL